MKQINIHEATATQLAEFANVRLGLDVNLRMGAATIRAAMTAVGYDKDYIEVADAASGSTGMTAARVTDEPTGERKMVKILIPNQDIPGSNEGREAVPVGVNGKVYLIKRGVPVDVPEEVIGVLKNANKVKFDRGPNGEPINPTFVPTYTYSILSGA